MTFFTKDTREYLNLLRDIIGIFLEDANGPVFRFEVEIVVVWTMVPVETFTQFKLFGQTMFAFSLDMFRFGVIEKVTNHVL
jgi:hypothetical protein